MPTIEIRHRWTNCVLFSGEYPDLKAAIRAANPCGAVLRGAVLRGADLIGAVLRGADLIDADLRDADLIDADLRGADLRGAFLRGAFLRGALLGGADLRGAGLSDADLSGADLRGADLRGAFLRGAFLRGALLGGADLRGADLNGATWRNGVVLTRSPLQLHGFDYPVTILDNHMEIGCQLHSIAEWRAFDGEAIARMDGRRARRFWDAHGAMLLALAASDGRGVDEKKPADVNG